MSALVRRTSMTSDNTTLPPIPELQRASPTSNKNRRTPSPSKTPSPTKMLQLPSKSPEEIEVKQPLENPFRAGKRRPSCQPEAPTGRRMSRVSMPDNENADNEPPLRRESIFNIFPGGRRASSLGTVGNRIASLLKAKNAFNGLRKRRQSRENIANNSDSGGVDPESFEIKELPKQPRFASTLSAEAQYAMMKGYEDVVYTNICNSFPEAKCKLRRSKTPQVPITIKYSNAIQDAVKRKFTEASDDSDETVDKNDHGQNAQDTTTSAAAETDATTTTQIYKITSSSDRTKIVVTEAGKDNADGHAESQKSAVPRLPEMDKRKLVMTYRYQSAMDILDKLRVKQGLHKISPRVTTETENEPVQDYNTWSVVWSHEFETTKSGQELRVAKAIKNR